MRMETSCSVAASMNLQTDRHTFNCIQNSVGTGRPTRSHSDTSVHKTFLNKRQTGRGTVDCVSAQDIFTLVGNTTAKTGILSAKQTIL